MFCFFSRGIYMVQLLEQEGYAHLLIQERISQDMVPYHFKASMNHLIMQATTTKGDFVAEVHALGHGCNLLRKLPYVLHCREDVVYYRMNNDICLYTNTSPCVSGVEHGRRTCCQRTLTSSTMVQYTRYVSEVSWDDLIKNLTRLGGIVSERTAALDYSS
jgi:hypothetical protein